MIRGAGFLSTDAAVMFLAGGAIAGCRIGCSGRASLDRSGCSSTEPTRELVSLTQRVLLTGKAN
jgi:hypothetical protein